MPPGGLVRPSGGRIVRQGHRRCHRSAVQWSVRTQNRTLAWIPLARTLFPIREPCRSGARLTSSNLLELDRLHGSKTKQVLHLSTPLKYIAAANLMEDRRMKRWHGGGSIRWTPACLTRFVKMTRPLSPGQRDLQGCSNILQRGQHGQ